MNIKITKDTSFLKKVLAGGLALVLGFSEVGCGEKAVCYKPERHVHLYVKNIDGYTVTAWFESEDIHIADYCRTDESMDINYEDARFFKKSRFSFLAEDNWDYLYHLMASYSDYLEFYWERSYYTWTEDEDGNKVMEYHHEDDWTTNPSNSDNTGLVRVVHHRYRAREFFLENGNYRIGKSPYVDDIREVLSDYRYVSDTDFCTKVYSQNYKRSPKELPKLTVNDFPRFEGPRLDCKDYYLPNAEVDYQWSIPKKEDRIIPDSSSEHTLSPANNSHSFNTGFCNSNFFDSLTRKSNFNHYNTHVAEKTLTLKRKYH